MSSLSTVFFYTRIRNFLYSTVQKVPLCMKWSMNFWLCKQEFDKQHGVVTYYLQKSAEMQLQPQGVTTAAQKKKKTMTCFLYVKPPPVHITRGMKHWRRRKVAARPRSSGDSETQRGASRSFSLFPSEPPNFRARSQAPGSPEKTRTWQRCRCWTSPCWTTRARSEIRFSSRSPSSAWRTYRRVSERLYVRHLRGFRTRYWVVKRRCVPLSVRGERTSRREWPVDHNYSRKVVEKFGAGAFVPLVPPSALRPLAGWRSPAVSPRSWLVSRAPFKPRRGTGKNVLPRNAGQTTAGHPRRQLFALNVNLQSRLKVLNDRNSCAGLSFFFSF